MNIWKMVEELEAELGLQVPGSTDPGTDVLSGHICARQGDVYLMGFDPIKYVSDLAYCQSTLHAAKAAEAWGEDQHLFSRYRLAQL